MQTIKTAVVVVLLLGVCYGAYVALNAPDPVLPPELEDQLALNVEEGASISIPQLSVSPAGNDLSGLTPPNIESPTNATKASTISLPVPQTETSPSLPLAGASPGNSAPPTLSLPESKPDTKTDKTQPGPGAAAAGIANNPTAGLGNDIPKMPDTGDVAELPPGLEGKSIPLPGPPSPNTSTPPLSLALPPNANAAVAPPTPDFPPLPDLPKLESGKTDLAPEKIVSTIDQTVSPPATTAEASKPAQPYATARAQALKLANDGKLREALAMMSGYYGQIELTHEEHLDLVDLLDALAGEVIYSKRHLIEKPFIVSAGDTLEAIANRYQISPETLAAINRMGDSKVVLAGTNMKVIRGPFRAEVNVTRGELTLFLGELYAGRFFVSIGNDAQLVEGEYKLVERRRDRSYFGTNTKVIQAGDPRNPYGDYWMHLGNDLCIHSSPASPTPELQNAGCISLAPLDAKDVYNLLTVGSVVKIKGKR